MTDTVPSLVGGWSIGEPLYYIGISGVLSLLVRATLNFFSALELWRSKPEVEAFFKTFWNLFGGLAADPKRSDYWTSFILGWLECLAYPVLMATGNWQYVGAWVGFKTFAQWQEWKEHRQAFNRFLIGNALVMLMSLMVLVRYVCVGCGS